MKRSFVAIPIPLMVLMLFLLFNDTETFEITGSVINEEGEPQVNHRVLLFKGNDEYIASAETDSLGRFLITYEAKITSSDPDSPSDMPAKFRLGSAYPNPFNPKTAIPINVPENTNVEMIVYNILGQIVMRTSREISKGSHEIVINLGTGLSQGQYLIQV